MKFSQKSAATTQHTKMCKRKVREMIDLVEKDMVVARDGDEKENSFVTNNAIEDAENTNFSLNNLPILDPPMCATKRNNQYKNQKEYGEA